MVWLRVLRLMGHESRHTDFHVESVMEGSSMLVCKAGDIESYSHVRSPCYRGRLLFMLLFFLSVPTCAVQS